MSGIDDLKIEVSALRKYTAELCKKLCREDGVIIVTHISQDHRYKLVVERAASTKGVDGFKVEVNGDDFDDVQNQIQALYDYAKDLTNPAQNASIVDMT